MSLVPDVTAYVPAAPKRSQMLREQAKRCRRLARATTDAAVPKKLTEFLRVAAASLRDLALRAPDIANELRRFADDLEQEAQRAARDERPRNNNAAD